MFLETLCIGFGRLAKKIVRKNSVVLARCSHLIILIPQSLKLFWWKMTEIFELAKCVLFVDQFLLQEASDLSRSGYSTASITIGDAKNALSVMYLCLLVHIRFGSF